MEKIVPKLLAPAIYAFALAFASVRPACAAADPPNVVFILTDNQAAWTLGCYGNPDIATPNIDRLAREGARFRHCYSSNAVCSPTRATLLTGLIPSQHGVHSYLRAIDAQMGPEAYSTIEEFRTLPEILSAAGYECGLVGKWHLGDNAHPQDGFTSWVTMPTGHTDAFYDVKIIDGGKLRREPKHLTQFWTDRAVEFLGKKRDRPFFLYLAYNGPYGLGGSMLKPLDTPHAADYADEELPSFPRAPRHPWQHGHQQFNNNVTAMRRYAAEISNVDDGVGRVMQALDELGLAENTLVVFTADQGLSAGQNGLWAMGDHTRPLTAFDPMIHTPLIYRQQGRIPAGTTSDALVSNYDFLPTMLDYLGMKGKTPTEPPLPGHSYAAALAGKDIPGDDEIFFEYENTRAIRTNKWKYIDRFPDGPTELYDLENDPEERENLADEPQHAKTQAELDARLKAFFDKYVDPQYDLSQGGRSKAGRRLQPQKGA